jgi:hypothetical protein
VIDMARLLLIDALAASVLAVASSAVCAQGLSDPTRPPGLHMGAAPSRPAEGGLVLQSVLIFPDARSAIISGEHVLLGQKVGRLRLIKVAESEVVLLNGDERRTLKLFPGVDKRPAAAVERGRN